MKGVRCLSFSDTSTRWLRNSWLRIAEKVLRLRVWCELEDIVSVLLSITSLVRPEDNATNRTRRRRRSTQRHIGSWSPVDWTRPCNRLRRADTVPPRSRVPTSRLPCLPLYCCRCRQTSPASRLCSMLAVYLSTVLTRLGLAAVAVADLYQRRRPEPVPRRRICPRWWRSAAAAAPSAELDVSDYRYRDDRTSSRYSLLQSQSVCVVDDGDQQTQTRSLWNTPHWCTAAAAAAAVEQWWRQRTGETPSSQPPRPLALLLRIWRPVAPPLSCSQQMSRDFLSEGRQSTNACLTNTATHFTWLHLCQFSCITEMTSVVFSTDGRTTHHCNNI